MNIILLAPEDWLDENGAVIGVRNGRFTGITGDLPIGDKKVELMNECPACVAPDVELTGYGDHPTDVPFLEAGSRGAPVHELPASAARPQAYKLLRLRTYFTRGETETRAWTIRAGDKAPQAAGVIHGDFERGFIRSETIAYNDFVTLGGEQPAKEAGKMRAEGKSYIVKDGDVLHFLFNT